MKRNLAICAAALLAGAGLAIPSAHGEVLASYDLGGAISDSNVPYPADSTSADAVATPLTLNGVSGYTNSYPGYFMASGWPSSFNSDNGYISFSVGPSSTPITFGSLTFAWELGSPYSAEDLVVRSSADNYASNLYSTVYDASDINTPEDVSVDLSSIGTQSGPVTFRLYNFGDPVEGGDLTGGLAGLVGPDQGGVDVIVSSAVPEPATLGLLGLGAVALLRRRQA